MACRFYKLMNAIINLWNRSFSNRNAAHGFDLKQSYLQVWKTDKVDNFRKFLEYILMDTHFY